MRRVLPLVFLLALVAVLAPAALAHDGGQGTIGEANDKIVTNAGFIVIAAIPLIILIASTLQWRLDKRKHARTAAKQHRSTGSRWRGGW